MPPRQRITYYAVLWMQVTVHRTMLGHLFSLLTAKSAFVMKPCIYVIEIYVSPQYIDCVVKPWINFTVI